MDAEAVETKPMKTSNSKTLITFAGVALVVPFVAVAALVGARAVAGAETSGQGLLLTVLAVCGALLGAAGSYARERAGDAREARALHITARPRASRRVFM